MHRILDDLRPRTTVLQGLYSLLGVPMTSIPFRAQNLILQAARATPYLVPMFHQEFEKLV
jgi:hypothetical protein